MKKKLLSLSLLLFLLICGYNTVSQISKLVTNENITMYQAIFRSVN